MKSIVHNKIDKFYILYCNNDHPTVLSEWFANKLNLFDYPCPKCTLQAFISEYIILCEKYKICIGHDNYCLSEEIKTLEDIDLANLLRWQDANWRKSPEHNWLF